MLGIDERRIHCYTILSADDSLAVYEAIRSMNHMDSSQEWHIYCLKNESFFSDRLAFTI